MDKCGRSDRGILFSTERNELSSLEKTEEPEGTQLGARIQSERATRRRMATCDIWKGNTVEREG
jgi:hypothetical protein